MLILIDQHRGWRGCYLPPFASASHFLMDDVLAAPVRGFPDLLTAFASQFDAEAALPLPSASHFLMDDDLAAPVRGLPFLPTAFASQSMAIGAGAVAAGVATGAAGLATAAGAAGAGWAGAAGACANAMLVTKRLERTATISFDMGKSPGRSVNRQCAEGTIAPVLTRRYAQFR